jgi:hypothetical protein
MIGLKLIKRFWVLAISTPRLQIDPDRCSESDITLARPKNRWEKTGCLLSYQIRSFFVQKPMGLRLTFAFRLNHKQTLKMMMKLLVDNNKTFSWNKTIIDFGIGFYLVYQPLKTYIFTSPPARCIILHFFFKLINPDSNLFQSQ